MKIRIPDINDNESFIEGKQSIVLLGANGAGKTRMSVWIDENNLELNVHRISAQKSLDMPEYVSPTELKKAEDRFLYGTTDDDRRWLEKDGKRYSRWGNNPETHMLNDYQPLMEFLMTENFEKSINISLEMCYNIMCIPARGYTPYKTWTNRAARAAQG